MKYLTIDWETLHRDVFDLSGKIKESDEKFDLIVTIARGGLTISHILSDFLNMLPIATFTISSYKDLQQLKAPEITIKLGNELHDRRILLVDDISDTGKTFDRALEYLKSLGAAHVKTAALYKRLTTHYEPDFFGRPVNDEWVIFPYDMWETISGLKKKFAKEGMSADDMKKEFRKLKLPDYYINSLS